MKSTLFTSLLAAMLLASPVAHAALPSTSITAEAAQQIPDYTLDAIFTEVAPVWGITKAHLWQDYDDGLVTVTDLGNDEYHLDHATNGGILVDLTDEGA